MNAREHNCIFCEIAAKKLPVKFEYEDNEIVAFCDKNPQAPVHVLIIPKAHIPRISDATKKNTSLLGQMLMTAKNIAHDKQLPSSGYRIVINCGSDAGQEVEHLHMHLLGGRQFRWPPG